MKVLYYATWFDVVFLIICLLQNIKCFYWRTASEVHKSDDWDTTLRALFTNFLTLGLTHKLCNPLDDWLSSNGLHNSQVNPGVQSFMKKCLYVFFDEQPLKCRNLMTDWDLFHCISTLCFIFGPKKREVVHTYDLSIIVRSI